MRLSTVAVGVMAISLVFVPGCKKESGGKGSGASTSKARGGGRKEGVVTVDGKALNLPKRMAVKFKGQDGYIIYMFNDTNATCEVLVSGKPRQVKPNEIAVRISSAQKGPNTAGYGVYTQIGIPARVTKKPAKKGDTVEICLAKKISFSPVVGKGKGKKVEMEGCFTAPYCGEMAQ